MAKQLAKRTTKQWVSQVLEQFNERKLTEKQACELLGLKRARLYKLRKTWLNSTLKGKIFSINSSGKHKKRSLTDDIQKFLHKELSYLTERAHFYKNKFNFAFLSEKVQQNFNIIIHRNTIRRFAIKKGYYEQTTKEIQKPCIRFEMDSIGALFQHDTSKHIWLPNSGKYHDLILTKDDHSRLTVGFILLDVESAWEHLFLARKTMENYGIPLAYYVDRHSIFKFNLGSECIHYTRRISEEEGKVQFKRALNSLDVTVLYAHDAKSKGKIEKHFDYFQRRLPVECEKYKIKTITEAMKILSDLVYFYNNKRIHLEINEIPIERWNKAIREKRNKLRHFKNDIDLDSVFSLHFKRRVSNAGSFRFQSKIFKLKQYAGKNVTIAYIPNKKIMALKHGQKIWQYHLDGYR